MKTLTQPRTLAVTLLCAIGLSMAAASAHANSPVSDLARLDGSIGRTVDAFTDGARTGPRDPFTDGAHNGRRDPFTDGAHNGPRDPYTDGARGTNEARSSFSDGA
ncbi:hypothetical protein AB4156_22265 [Cupriavidus sp. 2MCAB6]|uniref:hypothetical protein n=1 Tax=Cupriavidus sp. 2MCAB6 TaxID=3232981 RepID=UPI003F8E35B3